MRFGIYIHIPHCLQICPYCDFSKYELGKIMPPESYVRLLAEEIESRAKAVPLRQVDTVYFGGGTPSLFDPPLILAVLQALAKQGFKIVEDAEITIEINPGTVDQTRLDEYRKIGVTRFSVGAQTFNERLLKVAGRKHSSGETVETLKLLKNNQVNYSFDLLFALPSQSKQEVNADVLTALAFGPSHLSAYCLTVPENHPMSRGRAPETEQVEMFELIESSLAREGIFKYEVSNFAKPGFESKHNLLYWTDQAYWGIGVSSHSYFPAAISNTSWGLRFWNPPALNAHEKQIKQSQFDFSFIHSLPSSQREPLKRHEALTDFCHTSLRMVRGLSEDAARLKFGLRLTGRLFCLLKVMGQEGLVETFSEGARLTPKGRLVADLVFEKLTFLENDDIFKNLNSL